MPNRPACTLRFRLLLATLGLACSVDDRALTTEPANPASGSPPAAKPGAAGSGGGAEGCAAGGSSAQCSSSTRINGGSTPATNADPPAALERQFDGLVVQAAPWADLAIQVTGARLYRGARPEDLAARVTFSERSVYAALEININQIGNTETDYTDRNTWDLILADGTRLRPINSLGVRLVSGDSPTRQLYYEAQEETTFVGAALEINGTDRETYEPLRIPLDTATVFESQTELTELVGLMITPMDGGHLSYQVLEAFHGVNLLKVGARALRGERLVLLNCRVGFSGNFSESYNAINVGPKVSVAGNSLPPYIGGIRTIFSGDTVDSQTVYAIDAKATAFDVIFDTQDTSITRVPVSLPSGT